MNLNAISQQLGLQSCASIPISGVCIDSRKVMPDNLFVALRGERFDGHDYIQEAIANGAVAVLCERYQDHFEAVPQLVVPDCLQALAKLATWHRKTVSCPVIALTGSNGKTSVKEMIAAILPKPSLTTHGNLNNHIGVPLNILKLNNSHRYAAFELGANHLGEIALTVAMVQPQIALINNIAPAHIEGFGSIEGVANAKGEIYAGLPEGGWAVVNDDDEYAHFWDNILVGKHVLRFSLNKAADVYAKNVMMDEQGCARFTLVIPAGEAVIQLRVAGEHSVRNALAAAACCYAAGVDITDITKGLNDFSGVAGRMTRICGINQSQIIDDTYNANLRSVLTALDVLARREGHRILVLGDLGELGQWTQAHHEEIGRVAREKGIEDVMTCGRNSQFTSKAFGKGGQHFDCQESLVRALLPLLKKDTTVLVKGSRSAAMENIVRQLKLSQPEEICNTTL